MDGVESRFNVSLNVMGKVTRQYPQTASVEMKGEPKRAAEHTMDDEKEE